ncbi:MAG: rRNA methyltransferase [Azospirillum brasilense]|nr:MAG: rRNA methyltransferase [Azospirillum brasilense]
MSIAIILVRPQMGENIGAAARACANFGVTDLRLVAPRDGWPNPKAVDMAGRAIDLLDETTVYDTTAEAVADCQFVLATTGRARAVNIPAHTAREAASMLRQRVAAGQKVAVLFGPERTGLENEDVATANGVLYIPVAPEYPSLNLAQAAVVVLSEWFAAGEPPAPEGLAPAAPREELQGMFAQLEAALDDVNFWKVPAKKELMWRNIRTGLTRADLTSQEVATWRGMIRALRDGA